jgi:type IV pilus assembly protein PilM
MANLKRTVLGVEIGASEIRVVEMRGSANQPHILRAGSVRLPAGAMDGARIVQVDAVADLLRGLYNRLGCQSRSAIVGMGVQSVVTRILAIPRVPDSELRAVLEGELAHYQILRAGTGAFDYFRLDSASGPADALPSVLLMAVEDRIAQGYRLVTEKAGLQMLALEPVTLALFRAAYPMIEAEPAALCLAITPQRSELSILDHGQIRLYRRLEMGSNDFIRGRKSAAAESAARTPVSLSLDTEPGTSAPSFQGRTLLNVEPEPGDTADLNPDDSVHIGDTAPLPLEADISGAVVPQSAVAFANEVQRSLDYYRREFPNATAIGRILLSTNDPDAAGLSEWLTQQLRMEVRIIEPPSDPTLPRPIADQLEVPQGLRLLGATGLALQALTPDWKGVPRFNLLTGVHAAVPPIERDRLTVVMIAAVGVLFGGFLFGALFYRNAETESYQVEQKRRVLGVKQQEYLQLMQTIQDEKELAWIIKSDNLPVPGLLDLITQQMPPGVGLSNLNIQRNGHITIEGDARDMQDFNLYYLNLMLCPHFVAPRYQSLNTDPKTRITHFRVETSLKGTQAALASRP